VRFGLRGERPGVQTVEVAAWNGPAYIAGVSVTVAVDVGQPIGAPGATDMDMRDPEAGEFTLEVIYEASSNRYRFQLRSRDFGVGEPVYSEPLIGDRQRVISDLTASLNQQARNLSHFTPTQMQVFLKGLGALLYEHLIPDSLKQVFWSGRDRIRRLNILSPGDRMPWELLYLMDAESGDGAFLADTATVARWRYGAPPPPRLSKAPVYVVVPPGAPTQAEQEFTRLRSLLSGATRVSDLDALIQVTQAGGFGLLHFAAHNVTVPNLQGGSYVPFGETRFDLTFMGAVAPGKYGHQKPLVVMNACTSAGASPLYTETAGWADRFLLCGSGAFVGALWEVRDRSAARFSEAFYSELTGDKTVGEAMRLGRHAIGASDPTYLAYTLYGNPLATLE
jgi:hypothetical protein